MNWWETSGTARPLTRSDFKKMIKKMAEIPYTVERPVCVMSTSTEKLFLKNKVPCPSCGNYYETHLK
jgi:hypothetical protein